MAKGMKRAKGRKGDCEKGFWSAQCADDERPRLLSEREWRERSSPLSFFWRPAFSGSCRSDAAQTTPLCTNRSHRSILSKGKRRRADNKRRDAVLKQRKKTEKTPRWTSEQARASNGRSPLLVSAARAAAAAASPAPPFCGACHSVLLRASSSLRTWCFFLKSGQLRERERE